MLNAIIMYKMKRGVIDKYPFAKKQVIHISDSGKRIFKMRSTNKGTPNSSNKTITVPLPVGFIF